MRPRLFFPAIAVLAALSWIAIDQRLVAGDRSARFTTPSMPHEPAAPRIDVESSTSKADTPDRTPPATVTTAAPDSASDADAVATATASEAESESPRSRLAALERGARAGNRKAARDWVDAIEQCAAALYGDNFSAHADFLRHLDWNLFVPQHALRVEMLGSLVGECQSMFPQSDREQALPQLQSLMLEAIRLWAASGDALGRLAQSLVTRVWPPPPDLWRQQQALAIAHVNPADPQTLIDLAGMFAEGSRFSGEAWRLAACDLGYDCAVEIRRLLQQALSASRPDLLRDVGRILEQSELARADLLGPYAGGGASTLFTLVACDLGMPCGADSEMVQLVCALRGRCGYPDYETLMFDAYHGARARGLIQTHRAELLRRIRAGQIDGLFDPVRLPPKP